MRVVLGLILLLGVLLGGPAPGAHAAGLTVVSFTFDGTFKSQAEAAAILAGHGMAGTFYVNSGYLGFPAYLSVDQLREIARERNEVGGASLYGNDLSTLSEAQARSEVCDDRSTLAQLGFQVTSFSYPYGNATPDVKAAAQSCGYNSGRDYAGLYFSATSCSFCPVGESVPPVDDFRIRTASGNGLAVLEQQVSRAEAAGGGWVPLVFTDICLCPGKSADSITPQDFIAFVKWLGDRPASTVVKTVDQVMGGPLKPVHGVPLRRLVPDPSAAISPPVALSDSPAWTVFGYGIGQAQIILVGVLISATIVVTFRLASRKNRYAH